MKHLLHHIEKMNNWRSYEGKPFMFLPLSQEDINEIAEDIDCAMSPENLHCDGEISVSQANSKAVLLQRAFAELKAHASSQGLEITTRVYEID